MMEDVNAGTASGRAAKLRFWPEGWWRIIDIKIGVIPLPVYVLMLALLATFVMIGKLKGDISTAIALLAFGGFTCAEIGKRLPVLRHVGAAAIFATFVPSYLVYAQILPDSVVKATKDFTTSTSFLYLFIASIIVGSILGMDRTVLIRGFVKIFGPLAAGSVVAAVVGTTVGTLLGLGPHDSFFYIVIPIMAGGVGEGAIPLSIGYSEILHQSQNELLPVLLPPVMLSSLTAILLAGTLNYVGKRYPHLTGEGHLQPGEENDIRAGHEPVEEVDAATIAAAGVTAVTLYLVGVLFNTLFDFPAPVVMLVLAVLLKLARVVSPTLQRGAFVVFRFFSTAVTYPLLFAIGVTLTPWDKLVAAFTLPEIITIVSTVVSIIATGFFVGRAMKMYPIDTAIVVACHSGQGGTGDVAILTAANRMALMPFAQIATRTGGAIIVTLALIAFARFG